MGKIRTKSQAGNINLKDQEKEMKLTIFKLFVNYDSDKDGLLALKEVVAMLKVMSENYGKKTKGSLEP